MNKVFQITAWILLGLVPCLASGQENRLQGAQFSSVPVALNGEPFGVLMAEIPLPPSKATGQRVPTPRILVRDDAGRIFYSVLGVRSEEVTIHPEPRVGLGRPGGLLDRVRSAIRGEPQTRTVPVAVTVAALYRGTQPLNLRFTGDISQTLRVVPRDAPLPEYRQLLSRWWKSYTDSASSDIREDDFPTLVHKYLTAMLASRLDLPRVDLDPPEEDQDELSQPLETLALLAAIEPLREQILEDVLSVASVEETADAPGERPVPQAPVWEDSVLPPISGQVEIESLATRVPPECFYLRFGSFSNYVWFQDIAERYGGDIAQAVLLRGFNYDASARMERMLASKMTAIAKMFGDKLIGDMAVIGTDLYMKEGASLGVVFYAKNPGLLTAAIESDRRAIASKTPDAQVSELTISGKRVLLLSTPDNRIRSFYVSDGPFVFVTTSQTLMQRFLEVAGGDTSLAQTQDFRWARTWMPDANDYSVFAYFSPDFFRRLVSPQYQIELRRRLEAIAHLEIAEVASRAAVAEGMVHDDIEQLVEQGLLPTWFDRRPDGAQTLRGNGRWLDSRRGARGSFLPIADVPLLAVTRREADNYAKIAQFYQDEWRHMDPMVVGIRRFQADGSQVEKVAFEGYIAPFEAEKYGWIARQLGEPTPVEIGLPVDDVASVQLHVRGRSGLAMQSGDYHLFGGIKDMTPPDSDETQGLFKTLQALRAAPAYIGAWPKPGLIEQLPLGLGRALATPDYAGYSRMVGGLWRWQDGAFSLLSFNRSILDGAVPQLNAVETRDMAQARLQIANLSGSQLTDWINRKWYARGWKSSQGNARLLDAVHQQLKVAPEDCLEVAQNLLDVRLQCPLGGTYELSTRNAGSIGWWQSTAWQQATWELPGRPIPPPDYQAPWIEWFRGAKVHVTQQPNSLAVVGELNLEMQPLSVDLTPSIPTMLPPMNFDLFSLPQQLFGGGDAKQKEQNPQVERRSF